MLRIRQSPFMRTVVIPVALLSFLSACHKWVPVKDPVAASITQKRPEQVRVTTTDDERFVLKAPSVEGDTLSGVEANAEPRAIALADIATIERRKSDAVATTLVVVGTAFAALLVLAIAACAGGGCAPSFQ